MSKRVSPENLTEFCVKVLTAAGWRPDDANIIAETLVLTDTWGTFSHGTNALANYVNTMRMGGISATSQPEVVEDGGSFALIDGHACMGMLSSTMAMNLAIEKARKHTITWVGVRNSSHFGAAGVYAYMAARNDMIGIAMSNADPNMVVPGAKGHVIGNNPVAYAVPAGKEYPLFLDIALSAVAAGKIFAAKTLGKSIPDNWVTDKDGLPSTEVGDWPNSGSMAPMAWHKGYGIAMLIEVLAGALTSAGMLAEVKSWILQPTETSKLGHAFIAINIGDIIPIESFKARMDTVIGQLRGAPQAKGSERIYVPGEIEWEKREDALRHGIALPEHIFSSLHRAAEMTGIGTELLG